MLLLFSQSCPTLCDPMDCSTLGFPVLHHLPEFAQTRVHWVSDAISSSVTPFSSCPQSFPAPGSFAMSQLFASGGQSIGVSASVLPMNIQDWFPLGLTGLISLLSKELSRVLQHHNLKASILQHSALFVAQVSHLCMTPGKTIASKYTEFFILRCWPHASSRCTVSHSFGGQNVSMLVALLKNHKVKFRF